MLRLTKTHKGQSRWREWL